MVLLWPLEFLIALVQSQELDIEKIPLKLLTEQYLQILQQDTDLDKGAEFVGSTSFLIWWKSKQLLPQHEQSFQTEEEQDPRFEIIHHLIDYCKFKEAGKQLSEREQQQSAHYFRGVGTAGEIKKPLGIEHLTLDDFASLFKKLVSKASSQRGIIHEEEWKVSDKILMIRKQLAQSEQIEFNQIFSANLCREELIVIFLAILEMMKGGEVSILKITQSGLVIIVAKGKIMAREINLFEEEVETAYVQPALPGISSPQHQTALVEDPYMRAQIKRIVEALLFTSSDPLSFQKIREVTDTVYELRPKTIREILLELQREYLSQKRSFRLEEIAEGFLLRTCEEYSPYIELLIRNKRSEKTFSGCC